MDENLNPAYLQGLTASNRLTDARGEVYRLADLLPPGKGAAAIRIYNDLCRVHGALENLLQNVSTISEPDGKSNHKPDG